MGERLPHLKKKKKVKEGRTKSVRGFGYEEIDRVNLCISFEELVN